MSNEFIEHRGIAIPIKQGMFGPWYLWGGRRFALLQVVQETIDASLNQPREQRTQTNLVAAQRD
jgi:hypothetical protein